MKICDKWRCNNFKDIRKFKDTMSKFKSRCDKLHISENKCGIVQGSNWLSTTYSVRPIILLEPIVNRTEVVSHVKLTSPFFTLSRLSVVRILPRLSKVTGYVGTKGWHAARVSPGRKDGYASVVYIFLLTRRVLLPSRGCTRIFRDLTYWCSLKCRADTFKDGVVAKARPLSGALQCLERGFCSRIKHRFALWRFAILSWLPSSPFSTLLFVFHRRVSSTRRRFAKRATLKGLSPLRPLLSFYAPFLS